MLKKERRGAPARPDAQVPIQLISGGQSGVDRAVLDVAIAHGIPYGGWCPKGGWAEDFPEPPGLLARYPQLAETPLADPAQRTAWNLRDANAVLVIVGATGLSASHGTAYACDLAHQFRKPLLVARLGEANMLSHAALWLRVQLGRHGAALKLAIGGPRASEAPGIYEAALAFLRELIGSVGQR